MLFAGNDARDALKSLLVVIALAASLLVPVVFCHAQTQPIEMAPRKVVHRVPPEYPAIVKNARIGGVVHLRVTVLPNGEVAKVEPIGGNPIFLEYATKAVLMWKFTPAALRTEEDVNINFNPN